MAKVLIIGAGGVGSAVTKKCAQVPEVFSDILLASRTIEKCRRIQSEIKRPIEIAKVDADSAQDVTKLIRSFQPDVLINVALPYQDLSIMDACLNTGTNYLDTANYEPPDKAKFEYKWQWAYNESFKNEGIMGVLGCGFDPGASNAFCAYAQEHLFDEINYIDILDCNGGTHGQAFATNFNPEVNIREVLQAARHWTNGMWIETPPIIDPNSACNTFDYPEIGPMKNYLLYHEELESLVNNIKGLKRIRFWMTFSESYLTYLRVLHNIGMTRIDPVLYEGKEIIPVRFLKSLLPDPSSLAKDYRGKVVIGCLITGCKSGKEVTKFIHIVCDHAACNREIGSQAISYTTGVPAMIGAMLMIQGKWKGDGIFNVEQLNPDPFMENLGRYGLPWTIKDCMKLQ